MGAREPKAMTRDEALALLKGGEEGVEEWNARRGGDGIMPGLMGAYLEHADLRGANLEAASLAGASLSGADLSDACLEHADLRRTSLEHANLGKANLERADLYGATLLSAVLNGANLTDANLSLSRLGGTDLTRAKLVRTNLTSAHLARTILDEATILDAQFQLAALSDMDLGELCRCHGRGFFSFAQVDYLSIIRSIHEPRLKEFLRATEMPKEFIEHNIFSAQILSPAQRSSLLHSTFISYGSPDEGFARKLNEALRGNGVPTFFAPIDAEPGQKWHKVMRDHVKNHDRMILVCSRNSLNRKPVQFEIKKALEAEVERGEFIIPIRLDDYVIEEWEPEDPGLKHEIVDRVIADFRNPDDFNSGVGRLIQALGKGSP